MISMAVDVSSSEISSPRISFSHDLKEQDLVVPVPQVVVESSTIDFGFEFCTSQAILSSEQISSADELFADGKILPKKNQETPTNHHRSDQPSSTKKKRLIEFLSTSSFDEDEDHERPTLHRKPFWQFPRSSSLNSSNGLLRSSLHFLTRSNSTGSAPPSAKPAMHKQNSLKEASSVHRPNNNNTTSNNKQYYYYYNNVSSSKRPSLGKSTSGKSCNNSNGVRINPVLNINAPTYIAKGTASLFGLRSIFCTSNKSKKKRK